MKIDYSFLTGKIYSVVGKRKEDITKDVVLAVQIMLHNGVKFDELYSKLDSQSYEIVLRKVNK